MSSLADWRESEQVWKEYRDTGDLQMFRKELLTNPIITNVAGERQLLFYFALKDKDVAAAGLLVELGIVDELRLADRDDHYLHWIIEEGDDDPIMVEFLLDHGADLEQRGDNDWTPLHVAAIRGKARIVEFLLDRGADINARTEIDGCVTPLMEAAWAGKLQTIRLLLERGADPDLKNDWGYTAADIAAENKRKEAARLLREW